MLAGGGAASEQVVLVADRGSATLCLLQQQLPPAQQKASAVTLPDDGSDTAGILPTELALGSSMLQWAAKVVEQAYAPPRGTLYTSSSDTSSKPTYHRVLLGTSAAVSGSSGSSGSSASLIGVEGATTGVSGPQQQQQQQVLWALNPAWALATSGFYRLLTLGALLPRQLDLDLTFQADGSCDLASNTTGGLQVLARLPLAGLDEGACPDLAGVLVVRSASAPLDANKFYVVTCQDGGLPPRVSPVEPWSKGPMLTAAAVYSCVLCGFVSVAATVLAARWVSGQVQQKHASLARALQQLKDMGQVQLHDGSFLVKVRKLSSPPPPPLPPPPPHSRGAEPLAAAAFVQEQQQMQQQQQQRGQRIISSGKTDEEPAAAAGLLPGTPAAGACAVAEAAEDISIASTAAAPAAVSQSQTPAGKRSPLLDPYAEQSAVEVKERSEAAAAAAVATRRADAKEQRKPSLLPPLATAATPAKGKAPLSPSSPYPQEMQHGTVEATASSYASSSQDPTTVAAAPAARKQQRPLMERRLAPDTPDSPIAASAGTASASLNEPAVPAAAIITANSRLGAAHSSTPSAAGEGPSTAAVFSSRPAAAPIQATAPHSPVRKSPRLLGDKSGEAAECVRPPAAHEDSDGEADQQQQQQPIPSAPDGPDALLALPAAAAAGQYKVSGGSSSSFSNSLSSGLAAGDGRRSNTHSTEPDGSSGGAGNRLDAGAASRRQDAAAGSNSCKGVAEQEGVAGRVEERSRVRGQQQGPPAAAEGATSAAVHSFIDSSAAPKQEQQPRPANNWSDFESRMQALGEGVDADDEDTDPALWTYHIKTRLGTYLPLLVMPDSPQFTTKNMLRALLGLKFLVVAPEGRTGRGAKVVNAGDAVSEDLSPEEAEADIITAAGPPAGEVRPAANPITTTSSKAWAAPPATAAAAAAAAAAGAAAAAAAGAAAAAVAAVAAAAGKPRTPTPYELYVQGLEARVKHERLWRLRRWHHREHSTESRWLLVYQGSKSSPGTATHQLLKPNAAQEEGEEEEDRSWLEAHLQGTAAAGGGLMGSSPAPSAPGQAPHLYHGASRELQELLLQGPGAAVGAPVRNGGGGGHGLPRRIGGGSSGSSAKAGAGGGARPGAAGVPAPAATHGGGGGGGGGPPSLPPALEAAADEVLGPAGCLELLVDAAEEMWDMVWGALHSGASALHGSATRGGRRGRLGAPSATAGDGGAAAAAASRLVEGGASAKVLLQAAVQSLAVLAREAGSARARRALGLELATRGSGLDRLDQQQQQQQQAAGAEAPPLPDELLTAVASQLRAATRLMVRQFLRDLWAIAPKALPVAHKRAVMLRLGKLLLAAAQHAAQHAEEHAAQHAEEQQQIAVGGGTGGKAAATPGVGIDPSAAVPAAVPAATDDSAWSHLVWDAALGDVRAALQAATPHRHHHHHHHQPQQHPRGGGALWWQQLSAAAGSAARAAPAWALRALGLRVLLILLLGSLAPLASTLVAASAAVLWIAPSGAAAWASSSWGFCMLLLPGAATTVLLAVDLLAALGVGLGEALRFRRRSRGAAGSSSEHVGGGGGGIGATAALLLRDLCVLLLLVQGAALVWYLLMVVAWLGLSGVLGAGGSLAIASTVGAGAAMLWGHVHTMRESSSAVAGRLQHHISGHAGQLRSAANRMGLCSPIKAPRGRAAFVEMLHAQTQGSILAVNRNADHIHARLASHALPPGKMLANLAELGLVFAAGLIFIYLSAAAFGLSIAAGIAVLAPLSALGAHARGRQAAAAHTRGVHGLLPRAVGRAVHAARDAASGHEGVDGGLERLLLQPRRPPPSATPSDPEQELEIASIRINALLTAISNHVAHGHQRDGDHLRPAGSGEDPELKSLTDALHKVWSELVNTPPQQQQQQHPEEESAGRGEDHPTAGGHNPT
ncbi:hypothetical protein HYH02_010656 [Chlamydomonas schloesseri]|uniref:Uncharacterized protein n=1 Tax=Chlamydomonas schloesseri TaxID=2026947 RepID=A0A835T6L7_9CHLO|nr:hypothetical protein HYH02_010656 [Chlamydomonas schloesseri]|eukprot:KAG2439779.1 hypothetical protein HYH02_010656 [Chlamydomonas schloesseri]